LKKCFWASYISLITLKIIEEVFLTSCCIIPYNLENYWKASFLTSCIIPYNLEDDRRGDFDKLLSLMTLKMIEEVLLTSCILSLITLKMIEEVSLASCILSLITLKMIEEVSLASCIIPYNLEDDRRGFFGKLYYPL
jgi:hypothetical protein